jgi:hypothetical protein
MRKRKRREKRPKVATRSKALIDAMEEDELSSDEEIKDSLMIVE